MTTPAEPLGPAGPGLPPTVVIGCGLIGTSIALGLRAQGIDVHLRDADPEHLRAAVDRGAGSAEPALDPALVVVAVPPAATVDAVLGALQEWPGSVVTDVASIKDSVVAGVDLADGSGRFVGGHPMAGSERSGPEAASAQLFEGRPWVITPGRSATDAAVRLVEEVAVMLGGVPVTMEPATHDEAVALVSHVPQVMSSLTAARLLDAPSAHLALAGQGVRDVTRVAGSDPTMWREILRGNAVAVRSILRSVRQDLDDVLEALEDESDVGELLLTGQRGSERLPGKHGGVQPDLAVVLVQVSDRPGELSRLFARVGQIGVNIEDLRIDHELGRPVGLVEISVLAERADHLVEELVTSGWTAYR